MNTETITLILTLSLLLWLSPHISKLVRLPTPVIEILLGAITAYWSIIPQNDYFTLIAHTGFLYLMFLAGMEVDLKRILRSSKETLRSALLFLGSMTMFVILFGLVFQLHPVIIVSMPLISIGLLAALSKEYGKDQTWISIAFIVGVIGEIFSIAALTVFDVASYTGFTMELFWKVSLLVGVLSGIYVAYKLLHVLFWWFPELKQALIPSHNSADEDIRLAMALFFIMVAIMLYLHLELALGAFIAGVAISTFFHHEKELETKMSSLGFGFLVPLFFIHVGTSLPLDALLIDGVLLGALLISAIMIVSRILAAATLKPLIGTQHALLSGLALSMPLTLLVAVATIGKHANLIEDLHYYQLILASIIEVFIIMLSIKVLQKRIHR